MWKTLKKMFRGKRDKLATLIKAVVRRYEQDPTAAGLVLSYLPRERVWYASVARYKGAFAQQKQIICSAKCETLRGAIEACAASFLQVAQGEERRHVASWLDRAIAEAWTD